MTTPELPPVDSATIAAAKSKVGAAAQATLDTVRRFAQRAATVLSAPMALRESACHQTEILNADTVAALLRDKPITALRDVAGCGVRLGQLERAGYRTVADVLDAPAG